MATTAQHIAARNDNDLLQRLVATAEKNGIPNPQQWVEANRGRLVAVEVDGSTLADVHAYAVATYAPNPRPGEDASKVTDTLLDQAVDAVQLQEQPPAPQP